jgi:hypothetical protein
VQHRSAVLVGDVGVLAQSEEPLTVRYTSLAFLLDDARLDSGPSRAGTSRRLVVLLVDLG